MDRIGITGLDPGLENRRPSTYRGQPRPGLPYAGNTSRYSQSMESDLTSTAGYTLSGVHDRQQAQNLQEVSRELTSGKCSISNSFSHRGVAHISYSIWPLAWFFS
jgi:hypothetical protein